MKQKRASAIYSDSLMIIQTIHQLLTSVHRTERHRRFPCYFGIDGILFFRRPFRVLLLTFFILSVHISSSTFYPSILLHNIKTCSFSLFISRSFLPLFLLFLIGFRFKRIFRDFLKRKQFISYLPFVLTTPYSCIIACTGADSTGAPCRDFHPILIKVVG